MKSNNLFFGSENPQEISAKKELTIKLIFEFKTPQFNLQNHFQNSASRSQNSRSQYCCPPNLPVSQYNFQFYQNWNNRNRYPGLLFPYPLYPSYIYPLNNAIYNSQSMQNGNIPVMIVNNHQKTGKIITFESKGVLTDFNSNEDDHVNFPEPDKSHSLVPHPVSRNSINKIKTTGIRQIPIPVKQQISPKINSTKTNEYQTHAKQLISQQINSNDIDQNQSHLDDPCLVEMTINNSKVFQENQPFEANSDDSDNNGTMIQLLHFENLNKVLVLLFSGFEITAKDWNLNPTEENLLNSILKRKFFVKVHSEGITLNESDKFVFINELSKINTLKRPKDSYKMLLGRLFRILKRNHFEKHKFSNQNVYLFYQHYFGELAKKENLPIQAFFYPFERNNKFISLFPKISYHLNFRYYERIFKSDKFLNDIRAILPQVFEDHFSELKFKFSTLLKKWEKLFYNFDNDVNLVEKTILKYLQFNNRCKIPFTILEMESSIGLFKKMIARFEN